MDPELMARPKYWIVLVDPMLNVRSLHDGGERISRESAFVPICDICGRNWSQGTIMRTSSLMRALLKPACYPSLRKAMRALLALLVVAASATGSIAGEIRRGATMQVKPNSIWFEEAANLTRWQQLKRGGDPAALASYQEELLSHRDAWQFINRLSVKILEYQPGKNQVQVEMTTAGRMLGTKWFLDPDALVR
jgi:hypothetical protein